MAVRDKRLLLEKLAQEGPMSASELAASIQMELEGIEQELKDLLGKKLLTVVRREPTEYYWLSKEGKRLVSSR